MRGYAKVEATIWTGDTGRALREKGALEQLLALFLVTGPSANMIGLYHLPFSAILHYLGWHQPPAKALALAERTLAGVIATGFCLYDRSSETVWVREMAAKQVGEPLSPRDKRVPSIIREWQQFRKTPFYIGFFERYKASFHLPAPMLEGPSEALFFEAPGTGKAPRCQELEQEQEQEKEQEQIPPKPPRGERGRSGEELEIPEAMNTPAFREAWSDWLTYRKQRRLSRYTEVGLRHVFKQLLEWGPERAAAAIRYSIGKTWQGIFEAKAGERDARTAGAPSETTAQEEIEKAFRERRCPGPGPNG
jgi:hypothetical protein